jgi:hypothetical protein
MWQDRQPSFSDLGDYTVTTATAATYYMDFTGGSDSNDGLSTGAAWKNLSKIQSSSFAAGSQILFKRGETWRGQWLQFPSSGSAGSPILISDYGTGALPIIDGSTAVTSWTLDSGNIYYATWTFTSLSCLQE